MTYIIILSALFFGGITYILMAGASIIKEDDLIQENIIKKISSTL